VITAIPLVTVTAITPGDVRIKAPCLVGTIFIDRAIVAAEKIRSWYDNGRWSAVFVV
jgi:hypothetical protein